MVSHAFPGSRRLSRWLLVVFLLALPGVSRAQSADTLTAAGRRDGRVAAGELRVRGYAASGFVGGMLAGVFTPVALLGDGDRPTSGTLAVGGVGIVTAAASQAGSGEVALPREVEGRIRHRELPYRLAFRAAYAEQARRRRRSAALWGGVGGVAVGEDS